MKKLIYVYLALATCTLVAMYSIINDEKFMIFTASNLVERSSNSLLLVSDKIKIDRRIPKKAYPCLTTKIKEANLVASSKSDNNVYYLTNVLIPNNYGYDIWRKAIIIIDEIGCLSLTPTEGVEYNISIANYVPLDIARNLALQKWRTEIQKAGNKEKFKKQLLSDLEPGPDSLILLPEDLWALKKLGFSVSPSHN